MQSRMNDYVKEGAVNPGSQVRYHGFNSLNKNTVKAYRIKYNTFRVESFFIQPTTNATYVILSSREREDFSLACPITCVELIQ